MSEIGFSGVLFFTIEKKIAYMASEFPALAASTSCDISGSAQSPEVESKTSANKRKTFTSALTLELSGRC